MPSGSGLRWLVATALLNARPRRRRRPVPDWAIAGLATAVLLAGTVAGIAAHSLRPAPAVATGFGLSIAVVVLGTSLTALAVVGARRALAALGAVLTTLAVWTVVATAGVFALAAAVWLAFASALGYFALGLGVLAFYAAHPRRVVHLLEVVEPRPRS
jgi:hypothetical protein